jgi:hypothetical protein
MEWFDVKAIGFTLLIGSFTILGLDAILHYCLNLDLIGFFEGRLGFRRPKANGDSTANGKPPRSEKEASLTLTVFLAFAFGIGVLFEDFSRRSVLVDPAVITTIPARVSPEYARKFELPPNELYPVVTLIEDRHAPQPWQLTFDLAQNNAFLLHASAEDFRVNSWLKYQSCLDVATQSCVASKDPLVKDPTPHVCLDVAKQNCVLSKDPSVKDPTPDDFARSIMDLYFIAKNTAYAQKEYFDELREIEARYFFLGTLAVLSFFYLLLAIVFGVPSSIIRFRRTKRLGSWRQRWNQLRGIPVIIVIFLGIYLLSLWGFALENQAFNLRVFGYFSTRLFMETQHPESAGAPKNQSSPMAQPSPILPRGK